MREFHVTQIAFSKLFKGSCKTANSGWKRASQDFKPSSLILGIEAPPFSSHNEEAHRVCPWGV